MPDQAGSLERLALLLAEVLTQVTNKFGDNGVLDTFDQLGVHFPDELLTNATITTARRTVFNAGADLKGLTAKLLTAIDGGDTDGLVAASLALVTQCGRVTASFSQLADALGTAGSTLPGVSKVQIDALVQDLPRRITDLLLAEVAEVSGPVAAALEVLGVVERVFSPGDPADPTRPPHEAVTVHLDRLLPAITDPVRQLGRLYGWGSASFDAARLLTVLESVTARLGLPVVLVPGTATTPPELQVFAVDLGPTADGAGLRLGTVLPAEGQGGFDVPLSPPTWSAHVEATGRVVAESAGEVRPPFEISMRPPSGGAAELTGSVAFSVRAQPAEPFLLLGAADGSRLDFASARVDGGVRLRLDPVTGEATATPEVVGEITGGRLVIDTSEADGFVSTVLGDQRLQSDFGVGFSFTPDTGLRFHGSGGLEIRLPVHAALGPVEMQAVYLRVAIADDGSVPVELSAAFSAALGPVRASVDRIGVRAELTFPDGGGNLGPADLAFGFKPPSGVGLAVDVGAISGGGFLDFHPDRGEYSGTLELEFADFLALKAAGLITTRQPDGSRGFSLLLVLTGEFGSGIQLGYGFTLLAVGGLVGLNRGMNLQALVEGVRTGSIESVAFPRDVIANAPRILSDLNRFFPPEQGTFLVGPMAKIGWGTPTLVSISLGVIIEIPGNIAVLGVLRAALPTADQALLVIQAQFVGALELDKSRLWFFAQLFESRILTMTVDGGMGVLVAWGDNPDLIVTVGGFHPAYRPPPLPFPIPDRLSVDLLNRRNQLIRVSGYFAITSNTVQFGAKAELKLGFSAFGVEGHLGFDALFQFSPFRFAIHISADVTLKAFGVGAFGIDLDFQLEGPAPWRAHGRGSIGFLFFSVSANFDITWGEERDTTLPPVAVLPLLAAELRKTEGWETRLPSGGNRALVTLRQLPDTDDLVLHPLGTLFVRQRALPLNVRLDRIGGQRASDGRRFSVAPVPDSGLERVSDTGDRFAMAQFQNMSDAAKLSRPSYETQDSGLELTATSGTLASARVVRRSARYELHIIDSGTATSPAAAQHRTAESRATLAAGPKRFHSVSGAVFDELLSGSSTSRAALSRRQARLRQPFATTDTVRVTEQRFVVAYVKSNRQAFPPGSLERPSRGAAATFRSLTTARDALADFVEADPGLTGRLHVIPASEAAASPAVPGTWSDAGLLPVPASEVDLIPLANGRILLAGGTGPAGAPLTATAQFDPTADAWSPGPPLTTGRRQHTTTALADGRVLALGGRTATAPLATAEVFDPAAGTWTPTPVSMGTARYGHSATRLKDGRLLVAGGSGVRTGQEDGALASAELFDPATSTWATVAPMTDARTGHQAVLLGDGRVLVVGGALPTGRGRQSSLAYCELYDPTTRGWTPTGSLAQPRKGHQATVLPDGRVLVTGGDPVVAPDGTLDPHSLVGAELYDPRTGEWTAAASMPGGGRSGHRNLLLRSGIVLAVGGTGAPELTAGYRSVVGYSPKKDTWTTIGGLGLGRFALGAVELADDRVLVAGGVAAAGAAAEGLDAVQPAATGEVLIP